MKEQLISFETAELAKEKGFDIECNKWYDMQSLGGILIEKNSMHDKQAYKSYKEECAIYCPTQSLLKKWLREKHKIKINVASNSRSSHFPMNEILELDGTTMCGPKYHYNFKTYEEALESGLQEALKLI